MSFELKFTADTPDALCKKIAAFLAHAGNGTVTLADKAPDVADAASKAAGSTAVTVKPTAAEKKAAAAAEAERKAAEKKAADDDLLNGDDEDEGGDADKSYTIDDLRTLLPQLKEHPKSAEDVLTKLIQKHGGKKLTGVPAENHTAMYLEAEAMLKKLGPAE